MSTLADDGHAGPIPADVDKRPKGDDMKTIGNILWLVLAGFWMAIAYVVTGILQCLFIVTIPFGIQSFKLAGYALWPFGRVIVRRPGADAGLSCLGNGIWFVFAGLWLAIGHVITGVLLCITVIGIPLGLASFKMAGASLTPFGKMIVPASQASEGDVVAGVPALG